VPTIPRTGGGKLILPAPQPSPTPDASIPAFDWPPPQPSAFVVLPSPLTLDPQQPAVLADIDRALVVALNETGYYDKAYFGVPGGFVLVTRLEQIEANGTPLKPPDRWNVKLKAMHEFSLRAYLQALFAATPGYYRIIAFIVTDVPFTSSGTPVGREKAGEWLTQGANKLPASVSDQPVMKAHAVTAYIYEFEQPGHGQQAVLLINQGPQGQEHLQKAQLWVRLVR
jgi:hypothetical protein